MKSIINWLLIALSVGLLFYPYFVKADSIETVFGGVTYHLMGDAQSLYSNKITSDGRMIFTGLMGFGLNVNRWSGKFFVGQNSIAEPIFGGTISYKWPVGIFQAGPILGYYIQNDEGFLKKGITPASLGFGVVPIIGAEITTKLLTFDDNKYIVLNSVVTPILINETVSVGVEF